MHRRSDLKVGFHVLLLVIGWPTLAWAKPPANSPATATVPLEHLLKLHRKQDQADQQARPPANYTLEQLELSGRLLEGSLDLKVEVTITLLSDRWAKVPLVQLDSKTHLSRLPETDNGRLLRSNGWLYFVCDQPGSHGFDFGLHKRAEKRGSTSRVAIRTSTAALGRLALDYDPKLFSLKADAATPTKGGVVLYADDGHYAIAWRYLDAAGARRRKQRGQTKPPVDPVVVSAHVSSVSTLDGNRINRALYKLQLPGGRPIAFDIPADQRVRKVYLNGAAATYGLANGRLTLEAAPARAGDQSATVELVLSRKGLSYALSGKLHLRFPKVSWRINDLFVTLHLPAVFNYTWTGGTLGPKPSAPTVTFAYEIPTPGRRITLHRQLVNNAPDAQLAYAVDLSDKYFR